MFQLTLIAAGTDLTLECELDLRFSTAMGRSDCVCFLALIRFSLSPCVRTLFPFSSVGDCRADPGLPPLRLQGISPLKKLISFRIRIFNPLWFSNEVSVLYRVTHQVGTNLPLASEQKFRFGLARPVQAKTELMF